MPKQERTPTRTINRIQILPLIEDFDPQDSNMTFPNAIGVGLLNTDSLFAGDLLKDTQALLADLHDESLDDDLENKGPDRKREARIENALAKLFEKHKEFFKHVFSRFDGKQVTISLTTDPELEFFSGENKMPEFVKETNPLMGMVGVRAAIAHPKIAKMQIESVIKAADELEDQGYIPKPRIAVPVVSFPAEFTHIREIVQTLVSLKNDQLQIPCGPTIGTPRGAILADEIAQSADFIIIDTDLLTQVTIGLSKIDTDMEHDDVIPRYLKMEILTNNPFTTLDVDGVGKFVEMTVDRARKTNPAI